MNRTSEHNDEYPEPIGKVNNILPADWSGPQYPSFVANSIFLAHANTTENLLILRYQKWNVLIVLLDWFLYVSLIVLMYLTWSWEKPGIGLSLLVKFVFDLFIFLLVINFLEAAVKYSVKIILICLLLSGIVAGVAYNSSGLAREYLIEISVGLMMLVSIHFFANNYLRMLLSGVDTKVGHNLFRILLFWFGLLAVIAAISITGNNFVREYLLELGFALGVAYALPFFSHKIEEGGRLLVITFVAALATGILGYFQSGLLQAFLYELTLSLFLLITLDYAFKNARKKSFLRRKKADDDIDRMKEARAQAELEEDERKMGNPLYIELPPTDQEDIDPYLK